MVDVQKNRTLGIMGQQMLAQQECTRDEEWQLLHVVLMDLATRAQVGASTPARPNRITAASPFGKLPVAGVQYCWQPSNGLLEQVSFLAEKTGGDAAKLSAPVGVHGSETMLSDDESLAGCNASLHFNFLCEDMLVRSMTWTASSASELYQIQSPHDSFTRNDRPTFAGRCRGPEASSRHQSCPHWAHGCNRKHGKIQLLWRRAASPAAERSV